MRILPHHQDTGGFFVAVLEKVKALPWESDSTSTLKVDEDKIDQKNIDDKKTSPGPQRKRKRIIGYREDPFVFFKDEKENVWPSIK